MFVKMDLDICYKATTMLYNDVFTDKLGQNGAQFNTELQLCLDSRQRQTYQFLKWHEADIY